MSLDPRVWAPFVQRCLVMGKLCFAVKPSHGVICSVTFIQEIKKKRSSLKTTFKKEYIFALTEEREQTVRCDAASTENQIKSNYM